MSFLKNVSWMGSGTIISVCISALSVPILLKAFNITEVSYFLWLWTLIGIMNLADMGVSRGVSKYISAFHKKK
jgi:O-antigen/teichoic acid export membrane protein